MSPQTLAGHLDVRRFLEQLLTLSAGTCPVYPQLFEEDVVEPTTIRVDKPVDQLMVNREWDGVKEASVRHYGGS